MSKLGNLWLAISSMFGPGVPKHKTSTKKSNAQNNAGVVFINAPHRITTEDMDIIYDDLSKQFPEHYYHCSAEERAFFFKCSEFTRTTTPQTNLCLRGAVSARYVKRRKGTGAKQGLVVIGQSGRWEWLRQ